MMLFDLMSAQPSGDSKFHGGGEYIKILFSTLTDDLASCGDIEVCFDESAFLDEWICNRIREAGIIVHNTSSWDDIKSLLKTGRFDRFYSGLPRTLDKQLIGHDFLYIGTIHGIRSIEKPWDRYAFRLLKGKDRVKLFGKCLFKKKMFDEIHSRIKSLDVVLTASLHSKYSIERNLGIENVLVLYPPAKHVCNAICSGDIIPDGKYILLLGCNRWEKNPVRAIRALDHLFGIGQLEGYKAVCVGASEARSAFGFVRNPERFEFKGYVDPGELEELYRGCDIFLYPTLNEGFGYPPLEAMAYGKTCVVSAVCSLPEICGDAVYYINPYDILEIETRIVEATKIKKSPSDISTQWRKIRAIQELSLKEMVKILSSNEYNPAEKGIFF